MYFLNSVIVTKSLKGINPTIFSILSVCLLIILTKIARYSTNSIITNTTKATSNIVFVLSVLAIKPELTHKLRIVSSTKYLLKIIITS